VVTAVRENTRKHSTLIYGAAAAAAADDDDDDDNHTNPHHGIVQVMNEVLSSSCRKINQHYRLNSGHCCSVKTPVNSAHSYALLLLMMMMKTILILLIG
jgi:hypothetical protein